MYASMEQMSGNNESFSIDFGDSSQLTNWILDSGATCQMTLQVSDFIPGLLGDTDKYIEVAYGHHVAAKKKGQVKMKVCDNKRDPFIATLHSVLLAPDICDGIFSFITLMNPGHNCLFQKGFCMVYFGDKEKIRLLYHIIHRGNMHFWENKGNDQVKENSS